VVGDRPSSDAPSPEEISRLRARAEAGDPCAGGLLGELLADRGDPAGALEVWARAYGYSHATRWVAELLAEQGDLAGAVRTWRFSDAVWHNPEGTHRRWLNTLDHESWAEQTYDDPEDWAYMEWEALQAMLARRGQSHTIGELVALARTRYPAEDEPAG
jgi:hypothetical protein